MCHLGGALFLTHPRFLADAIVVGPLTPFSRDLPTRLDGTPVLVMNATKKTPADRRAMAFG
jgi:hypothetical protein